MKAIVLLSGGLDSSLALKLIRDQGIDVLALHFSSQFCRCDGAARGCGSSARSISNLIGVELKMIHLKEEYLEIVKNPRYGRGKNLNPCIDCRMLKFSHARRIMEEAGASFIVTGEVLGQRPMSQHKRAMELIEKKSGLEDLVVRPLSAKILSPTLPEREGWVDREAFLDFHGRNRTPQIKLAADLGIKDYPCPAGGCLLTNLEFCKRMEDLFDYGKVDTENVELLKVGRHFRFSPGAKLVVGRNEQENNRLLNLAKDTDLCFDSDEVPGPIGIGRGFFGNEDIHTAASIVARYSDIGPDQRLEVSYYRNFDSTSGSIETLPAKETELNNSRI